MPEAQIVVRKDADDLALAAAEWIEGSAGRANAARGKFLIALSGGSTPEQAYLKLASPDRRGRIDWEKFHVLMGDERFVPPDDPRSNLAMATRTLLSRVPIPYGNVLPISTQFSSAQEAVEAYIKKLSGFFGISEKSAPPELDLILLGIGDDGHTASLFPGNASLLVQDRWFTWSPPAVTPPPVDRITATLPFINSAREVVFLVSGQKKAAILRDILEDPRAGEKFPAAMVRPSKGRLVWLVDRAAASLLQKPS
jgi:6-phosphogluconolactonase